MITEFDVRQKTDGKNRIVTAKAQTSEKASVIFSLTHPDGRTEKIHADENGCCRFTVSDPQLWYCNTMGAQPLYTVCAMIISDDGMVQDKKEKRIGLRTVFLDRKRINSEAAFVST